MQSPSFHLGDIPMIVVRMNSTKKQREFILQVTQAEVNSLSTEADKQTLFNTLVVNNRGGQVCRDVRPGLKNPEHLYIKVKVFV